MTAWRRSNPPPVPYFRARLECGHVVKMRNHPMTEIAKYGCTAGLRCGYNLWWIRWWHIDKPELETVNETYVDKTEKAGDGET